MGIKTTLLHAIGKNNYAVIIEENHKQKAYNQVDFDNPCKKDDTDIRLLQRYLK